MAAKTTPNYPRKIVVRRASKYLFVDVNDVEAIEADGNYLRLHTCAESHVIRGTLKSIAGRLDPGRFIQISRSSIVNQDCIAEVESWFGGDYVVTLRGGRRLTLTRTHRTELARLLAGCCC